MVDLFYSNIDRVLRYKIKIENGFQLIMIDNSRIFRKLNIIGHLKGMGYGWKLSIK